MNDLQSAQPGLRERKKDKTRAALVETALRLFAAQGFGETTINQIAAEVDVSPRTLLRYFPTKEDIVVSQVESSMAVFRARFEEGLTVHPVPAALMMSARALIAHYEAQAAFYLAIERTIAASPEIGARKLAMTGQLADELATVAGTAEKGAAVPGWQIRLYTDVVFCLVRAVIGRWVAEQGKPSLASLFDEASALIDLR